MESRLLLEENLKRLLDEKPKPPYSPELVSELINYAM